MRRATATWLQSRGGRARIDLLPKVAAQRLILCEGTALRRRERRCFRLLDATRAHAHMCALDCYYHAARCRGLHERVGNLFCEPLLHLQPARAHVRHARKLREAEHSAVGQVADVAPAVKG